MFGWVRRLFTRRNLESIIRAAVKAAHLVKKFFEFLYFEVLVKLMRGFSRIDTKKRDKIVFIIKEALRDGNYNVITGVFDTKTEKITEGYDIDAKNVDSDFNGKVNEGLNICE